MGKLEQFKARAAAHGQTVTLYPFVAHPSGTYLDTPSGYPDPESGAYPAAVPAVTYGPAVSVTGFWQPPWSMVHGGHMYRHAAPGESVDEEWLFFAPGDQAVSVHDQVEFGGIRYEVNRITDRWAGGVRVMRVWFMEQREA